MGQFGTTRRLAVIPAIMKYERENVKSAGLFCIR